jgi:predicted secreted protein
LVLYAVCWFMIFLIVIPIRLQTQGDLGKVVPGTQAGAPEHHYLKTKAKITTVAAAICWGILFWIISSGMLTVRDLDWFNRMSPAPIEAPVDGTDG